MTGYEPPEVDDKDLGDFNCRNCDYYDADKLNCSEKHMMEYSSRPRDREGKPLVHALGCCEQIDRSGRYFQGVRRQNRPKK